MGSLFPLLKPFEFAAVSLTASVYLPLCVHVRVMQEWQDKKAALPAAQTHNF